LGPYVLHCWKWGGKVHSFRSISCFGTIKLGALLRIVTGVGVCFWKFYILIDVNWMCSIIVAILCWCYDWWFWGLSWRICAVCWFC